MRDFLFSIFVVFWATSLLAVSVWWFFYLGASAVLGALDETPIVVEWDVKWKPTNIKITKPDGETLDATVEVDDTLQTAEQIK